VRAGAPGELPRADRGARKDMIPLYKVHMPPDIGSLVSGVLRSGQLSGGPYVDRFEALLGEYLGNPLVSATGDVSSSLTLCLRQAGVGPGAEVLMSPLVCLSTSSPVKNLFADIRWCDVDPLTGNIDPAEITKRMTPRAKAIVVYHWAGNPADLAAIHAAARDHGLAVIEDAGEALGAEYHGKKIGATGSDFTVFSFYPNRHLTTIEGGALACAHKDDYDKVRRLKRYGIHRASFRDEDGEINPASDIPVAGWNSYMNHVAATVGVAQMEHLPRIVARHRENGLFYDHVLVDAPGVTVLRRPADSSSAYWVYTFLVRERDRLLEALRRNGVQASKVHLRNDLYTAFGSGPEDLPGVKEFSDHCLSVPCGWWVTDEERSQISDLIRHEAH
jgi:dTDP-4-amino-4,6-dideoxygalactose transaminase